MADTNTFPIKLPALRFPKRGLLRRELISLRRQDEESGSWLAELAQAYHLSLRGPARRISKSIRNENWAVETDADWVMVKRYRPNVEIEQIRFEHHVLLHLEERHFPAARLVKRPDGLTRTVIDGRNFAVYHYLNGYHHFDEHLYFPSQRQAFLRAEARTVAELHETLQDSDPAGSNHFGFVNAESDERGYEIDWYISKLDYCHDAMREEKARLDHPALKDVLRLAPLMKAELIRLDGMIKAENPEVGVVHGDFAPYNLLIKPGCPLLVVDFEMARYDWRLVDLVSILSTTVSSVSTAIQRDRRLMRLIIHEYWQSRRFDRDQLRLLPSVWAFMALRRVIVLWDNYLKSGDQAWLPRMQERLARLAWVGREKGFLENAVYHEQ